MTIPRRRVMNWIERGVEDPPGTPLEKMCGARILDANLDDRDIVPAMWGHAIENCRREPCVCGSTIERGNDD